MVKIFMLDGTKNLLYYNVVVKYTDTVNVNLEVSIDRTIAKLGKQPYDLIIVSRAAGKSNLYDIADTIKGSKVNKKAIVILLEENPTTATRFMGILRGYKVYSFKSNQITKLDKLVRGMSL